MNLCTQTSTRVCGHFIVPAFVYRSVFFMPDFFFFFYEWISCIFQYTNNNWHLVCFSAKVSFSFLTSYFLSPSLFLFRPPCARSHPVPDLEEEWPKQKDTASVRLTLQGCQRRKRQLREKTWNEHVEMERFCGLDARLHRVSRVYMASCFIVWLMRLDSCVDDIARATWMCMKMHEQKKYAFYI